MDHRQPATDGLPQGFVPRFLGLFLVLVVGAELGRGLLDPVLARPSAWLLQRNLLALGLPGQLDGHLVVCGPVRLDIVLECSPLLAWGLFGCFALAYPAGPPGRLSHLGRLGQALAVLAALAVFNHLRLLGLALAAWRWPAWQQALHLYLGQLLSMLACSGACAAWAFQDRLTGALPAVLRALLVATLGIGPWLLLQAPLSRLLDALANGLSAGALPAHAVAPSEGLSLLALAALVLATPSLSLARRAKTLGLGWGLLLLALLACRLLAVVVVRHPLAWPVMLLGLLLQQLALPLLLWLWLAKPFGARPASYPASCPNS